MGFRGKPWSGAVAVAIAVSCLAAPMTGAEAISVVGWHLYVPRWDPLAVGADGQSVELGITESSCGSRNLKVAVQQKRRFVRVTVTAEDAEYSGGIISCPGPHTRPFIIHLRRPLAGRPIRPHRSDESGIVFQSGETVPVPRVVGFASSDAITALSVARFHYRIGRHVQRAGDTGVVRQGPRAGAEVPAGRVITLVLAGR
jgi:hypothetical protein